MGFILELRTVKNDGIDISLIFLPVSVKHITMCKWVKSTT